MTAAANLGSALAGGSLFAGLVLVRALRTGR